MNRNKLNDIAYKIGQLAGVTIAICIIALIVSLIFGLSVSLMRWLLF